MASAGGVLVSQLVDYDPWGLELSGLGSGLSNNRAKFNGKETLAELGGGLLDFGARGYDATIGRWGVVDPMAEVSRRFSPFVYGNNNPVRFIDPDGMMATNTNKGFTYSDGYVNLNSGEATGSQTYDGAYQNLEGNSGWSGPGKGTGQVANSSQLGKGSQSGIAVGGLTKKNLNEIVREQSLQKGNPGKDGKLNYKEASEWSHIGNGVPVEVNSASLDLSRVYIGEVPLEGTSDPLRINLLHPDRFTNLDQGIVYGNILLVKDVQNRVKILNPDRYDFEIGGNAHPWLGPNGQIPRNVFTIFGAIANGGSGTAFPIIFTGYANVNMNPIPPKIHLEK